MAKFKFDWDGLKEKVKEEDKKKGFQKDERFWKPTVDEKGNATAIIRFLPDLTGSPWVHFHQHNFNYMDNGVKKYWIKNCSNPFKQEYITEYGFEKDSCPICKKNNEYYNSGFEEDKQIASMRKRKLFYISNILIVKNPANPDEEGKVKLFQYGQKIHEKIKGKMFPSDELKALGEGTYDEYMPFDLYEGANFKLVQCKQGEFPNYDKSEFGKQAPIGKDKFIEDVMEQVVELSEFVSKDKFLSKDEVIQKLGGVLGLTKSAPKKEENLLTEDEPEDITSGSLIDEDDIPDFKAPSKSDDAEGEEESDDDFFKNLK
jgi:hypothetical protein